MLQEAHRLKARGFDLVIGYLEPHARIETSNQVGDLEVLPRKFSTVGETCIEEMDVASIVKRKPQIVLVDELAHSNPSGSKHEKRYHDVFEILDHEISVITTMNVQHLESVADQMSASMGIEIRERVPDWILQRADQVVTVDVSIEELRERLRTGKIYKKEQAERALSRFFTPGNLSILRESALKEAAGDQIRRIDEQIFSHESVMVCLSSDPTSAETLIRRGTKMALQFSSPCFVVYVQGRRETSTEIDSSLQRKVQNNLTLAKRLGAEVVTLQSEAISDSLVNFAIDHNIRHAVFGKSRLSPFRERLRGSVILDFTYDALGVDVHVLNTDEGGRR
jgi:two-component system sensor histidine kinase KdpD